jgi:hypothetical protein
VIYHSPLRIASNTLRQDEIAVPVPFYGQRILQITRRAGWQFTGKEQGSSTQLAPRKATKVRAMSSGHTLYSFLGVADSVRDLGPVV